MPVVKITKTFVDNAPFTEGKGKQILYLDAELKGFGLLIGATAKSFVAQHAVKGRLVRVTIGRTNVVTVSAARDEAKQLLAKMSSRTNPINPHEERRRQEAQTITLRQALDLYLNAPKRRSPATIENYRHLVNRHLKDWLETPLQEIGRRAVRERHQKIARDIKSELYSGTCAANFTMRVFRAVYNRAMREHEDLAANPCINVDWYPEHRREAAIPSEQLRDWYKGVMALANPIRRDYLRFVLFTGLRRTNAAEVRWEHVDFDVRALHIPKPKSGRPFDLPLSDFLVELLAARRVENEVFYPKSPFVFPSNSRSGYVAEPKEKLDVKFTIHGLRNTFATVANSIKIAPYDLKLLLNHALPKGDVTAGYIQHELEHLRAPMQAITDKLLSLCDPQPETKVVSLRGGRKPAANRGSG